MQILESLQTFFLGKKESPKELEMSNDTPSFVPPTSFDGEFAVLGGYQTGLDVSLKTNQNERDLLELYRNISKIPEVSHAIDEIVNEMISVDSEDNIVSLNMNDIEVPESLKKKIDEEFQHLLNVMKFNQRGRDIVRRWYIDGRISFHKIVDKNKMKDGIKELRYINPTTIEKIVEYERVRDGKIDLIKTVKEYYRYNPSNKTNGISLNSNGANGNNGSSVTLQNGFWNTNRSSLYMSNQVIAVSPEAISMVTSGIFDEEYGSVLSHLHPAIKVANQLSFLEDALVIYRVSRAPERRVFYVDVGNMPKSKAEQYMRDMMTKFKNTVSYDSTTGAITDKRRFMSMMEDFWIPRRENGRATEVSTLPGGQGLSQMDDVNYFIQKLYKSLKIPSSRMNSEQPTVVGIGRSSEITRDEIRFQKFIDSLRSRFTLLFDDILGTQLILKGILKRNEWEELRENINYEWSQDNFYSEMKEHEILRERIQTLQMAEPYIGRFFTKEYVMKNVLNMSDDEYDETIDNVAEPEYDDESGQLRVMPPEENSNLKKPEKPKRPQEIEPKVKDKDDDNE